MPIRIFVDQGHNPYGFNAGAEGFGLREQDITYMVGAYLADLLDADPRFEVATSRPTPTTVLGYNNSSSLRQRVDMANDWGADYFISIHRNAFLPNKASGIEAWIYSKAAINGDAYRKAQRIVDALSTVTRLKNRGVKLGAPKYRDYAVNRASKMTSCLVEVGFVDNDKDNAAFDRTFDAMADAIAEAVCVNTGLKYVRKGDVDGNGTVDVNDARTVLRAAVGLEKLSPDAEKRADTDGDGKVTVNDARDILRTATGLDK